MYVYYVYLVLYKSKGFLSLLHVIYYLYLSYAENIYETPNLH